MAPVSYPLGRGILKPQYKRKHPSEDCISISDARLLVGIADVSVVVVVVVFVLVMLVMEVAKAIKIVKLFPSSVFTFAGVCSRYRNVL